MPRYTIHRRFHATMIPLHGAAVALLVATGVAGLLPAGGPVAATGEGGRDDASVPPAAGTVVLLVVDGLRSDEAADAGRMPFFASLTERTEGVVQTPVPCSAAAIETWVAGRVPSARAMLTDFWTGPVTDGGLIAAVARSGRPVTISGPTLWTGRYRPWAELLLEDDTFGLRDEEVLHAALDRLPDQPRGFMVVHLLAVDAAGHRRASKAEVTRVLQKIDEAAWRLAERMPLGGVLLVVSDHGRSRLGGHAGPEAAVRRTPVLMAGGPPGLLQGVRTQRDTHRVLARLLGTPVLANERPPVPRGMVAVLALAVFAAGCRTMKLPATVGWGAVAGLRTLALVVTVAAAWWSNSPSGLGAAGAIALIALASVGWCGGRSDGWPAAAGAAAAAAVVRCPAIGGEWPAVVGPMLAATVAAVGCVVLQSPSARGPSARGSSASGRSARGRSARRAGVLLGVSPLALAVVAGQSVSLSTLDTRAAFTALDAGAGLAAAVLVVLLLNAAPIGLVGWAVSRREDAAAVLGMAAQVVSGQAAALLLLMAAGDAGWAADAAIRLTAAWAVLLAVVGLATLTRSVRVAAAT